MLLHPEFKVGGVPLIVFIKFRRIDNVNEEIHGSGMIRKRKASQK